MFNKCCAAFYLPNTWIVCCCKMQTCHVLFYFLKLILAYGHLSVFELIPSCFGITVCQSSDYMAGLQIHTHMITTGNFSEISSFMPGLKTLMQIANQLRVWRFIHIFIDFRSILERGNSHPLFSTTENNQFEKFASSKLMMKIWKPLWNKTCLCLSLGCNN